jgi:hypothetical protein
MKQSSEVLPNLNFKRKDTLKPKPGSDSLKQSTLRRFSPSPVSKPALSPAKKIEMNSYSQMRTVTAIMSSEEIKIVEFLE